MATLKDHLAELNHLITQLRYAEALEKFYHPNVQTCENENPPVSGLENYKEAGAQFLSNISNYHAVLLQTVIGEGITACLWHYVFDHKQWGHWDKVQLSVQRWQEGKIIHERHHYRTAE